jgi:hypothetical protein
VGAAAQKFQLGTGLAKIRGLIEPHLAANQNLVGADNHSLSSALPNLSSLRLSKKERTFGRIAALCSTGLFEETFVKLSRFDPKFEAGRGE